MKFQRSWRSVAILFGASVCVAPLAYAADDTNTLAPVIITAQHRDESVQLVPIAVTVVSGKTLEDTNFQNLTHWIQLERERISTILENNQPPCGIYKCNRALNPVQRI